MSTPLLIYVYQNAFEFEETTEMQTTWNTARTAWRRRLQELRVTDTTLRAR